MAGATARGPVLSQFFPGPDGLSQNGYRLSSVSLCPSLCLCLCLKLNFSIHITFSQLQLGLQLYLLCLFFSRPVKSQCILRNCKCFNVARLQSRGRRIGPFQQGCALSAEGPVTRAQLQVFRQAAAVHSQAPKRNSWGVSPMGSSPSAPMVRYRDVCHVGGGTFRKVPCTDGDDHESFQWPWLITSSPWLAACSLSPLRSLVRGCAALSAARFVVTSRGEASCSTSLSMHSASRIMQSSRSRATSAAGRSLSPSFL